MNRRDFLKSIGKVIGGLAVALGVIKVVPKSDAFLDAVTHKDAGPLRPTIYCDGEYERLRQEVVEMFRPQDQMYYRLPDGRIVGDGWDVEAVQWGKMT